LQLARVTDSEDSLSLSTAVWFAWGVLLNSGIGEGMYSIRYWGEAYQVANEKPYFNSSAAS